MSKVKLDKPKYIAEGFPEDASALLTNFVNKSTVRFADFAETWRKHHFSLVFMGRPDEIENTEFTNELFKISTDFLSSPSFYTKVGGVYLLYSLYLNQIADPYIKIRVEMSQWRILKSLRIEAVAKKYRTLHYVIDYLMKNALMYVGHQTLMGPHTSCLQSTSRNDEVVKTLNANYKSGIAEYRVSNNLKKLQDLHNQYLEVKKDIGDDIKLQLNKAGPSYEEFIQELQNLVEPPSATEKLESVGNRRAKIKAKAFEKKSITRYVNKTEDEISHKPPKRNIKLGKKKGIRVPASERRVGRPPKNPKPVTPPEPESDDEIDISHLLSQQQEFYLPPVEIEYKKCRTRREHYYKESPKRDDDSSDHDNPV